MAETLRIGIIGAGAVAQVAHLPTLTRMKGVQVVAICDTDGAKAQAVAQRFRIPDHFDDIEELLKRESLDAILVSTPNHLHESHILAGLSAGLHVVVEKPLAMSAASAIKLQKAAEKRGKLVMVGMNHRYRPDVQIVKSFVQSGELGALDSARGSWHVFGPSRNVGTWRTKREQAGGGAVLDLGLSILDLGLWLSGTPEPRRVLATMDRPSGARAVEQSGSFFVACEGMSIFVDVTWHHVGEAERFGIGLRGAKGTAAINPLAVYKEFHGNNVNVAPTGSGSRENATTASYRAEWAHFVAAIRGEAPVPSLQEHVTLHRIIDAVYKSAEDGRDVAI
jgi:predicted dehydrogenase